MVVGAPKVRALLAVLLLHRGEVVSTDRLIDALWGERASPTAAKTVQVYVSNLRKALGDGLVVTEGRGYGLQAEPGQVDVDRFEALVAQGRRALEQGDALTAAAASGPPIPDDQTHCPTANAVDGEGGRPGRSHGSPLWR